MRYGFRVVDFETSSHDVSTDQWSVFATVFHQTVLRLSVMGLNRRMCLSQEAWSCQSPSRSPEWTMTPIAEVQQTHFRKGSVGLQYVARA